MSTINNIIENEIKDFASVLKIPNFQYEFKDDDDRDNYITELFHKYGDNLLDHNLFIKSANLNNAEEELRLLFWKTRFNKDWILLTKEIIINYFEFENNEDMFSNFIKQNLKSNFVVGKDYKVVKKDHPLVESYYKNYSVKNNGIGFAKNASKFYIITGYCFKELMLKYSKTARSLFIKVESLTIFTYLCIKEYNKFKESKQKSIEYEQKLHDQQNEINLLKQKTINLKKERFEDKYINYSLDRKQKIYALTTKQSALKFNTKVGGTISKEVDTRVVSLNTSFPKGEGLELVEQYEVYNYKIIEHLVHKTLDKFRSKEHIIGLPWHYLRPIILQAIECEKLMIEQYNKTIDNILKDIDNNNFNEELPIMMPIGKKKCMPLKTDNQGNIENNLSNEELIVYKQEIQKLSTKNNTIPLSKLNKPKYIAKIDNNIFENEEYMKNFNEHFYELTGYHISIKKGKK